MNVRILSRVIIYDLTDKKLLLARNKDANFWYAPGGGWEHEKENLLECAKREVIEECGIKVEIKKLLYVQEFHATEDTIFLELFWLGLPESGQEIDASHLDLDPNGQVEEVKWFSQSELQDLKVFPKRLKNSFWENISTLEDSEDSFIGVS